MEKVGSTGPYQTTEFVRKLWLENEKRNVADDRFERDGGDEDVGILVRMDQMFNIMVNELGIASPWGLRASNSKVGKVIGGHKSLHKHQIFSTSYNQTSRKVVSECCV